MLVVDFCLLLWVEYIVGLFGSGDFVGDGV